MSLQPWQLSEQDIAYIAEGAGILGTGGGGNPYLGKLMAWQMLLQGFDIQVIAPEELDDDDVVIAVGGMGAPTVGIEKFERGDEFQRAVTAVCDFTGLTPRAVMSEEIGGANAIKPMLAAAKLGVPVVDADAMGRAFPELQMNTFSIYGLPAAPAALCDDKGNTVLFTETVDAHWLERLARAATVAMGCRGGFALPPIRGKMVKAVGIRYTISQAWQLGEAVSEARLAKLDPVEAVLAQENGKFLFQGKIVDVQRWTTGGFARGRLRLEGFPPWRDSVMEIEFQNENLVANLDGELVTTVPDLICVLDSESGRAVATEQARYGLRVSVIGLPASPLLRSDQALAVVGPRAFGYHVDYTPIGDYVAPAPIRR